MTNCGGEIKKKHKHIKYSCKHGIIQHYFKCIFFVFILLVTVCGSLKKRKKVNYRIGCFNICDVSERFKWLHKIQCNI